jgi:hypothetical protein
MTSSSPTTATVAINATSCAGAVPGMFTSITGQQENKAFNLNTSDFSGFVWEDTGGATVADCGNFLGQALTNLASGSTAGGTAPGGRLGQWGPVFGLTSLVKTGAITCVNSGVLTLLGNDVTKFLCPTPAFISALPTISGTAKSGSTLTAGFPFLQGARPSNMAATTTWAWQKCDGATGLICSPLTAVAGSPNKYLVTTADKTFKIRVTVHVSNSDGSVPGTGINTGTGTSNFTSVITQ